MIKVAGNVAYPFVSYSPSSDVGLGYRTLEEAENHSRRMNVLLDDYPNGLWNTEAWKTKPEPWIARSTK